jgi:hypothetical protein
MENNEDLAKQSPEKLHWERSLIEKLAMAAIDEQKKPAVGESFLNC